MKTRVMEFDGIELMRRADDIRKKPFPSLTALDVVIVSESDLILKTLQDRFKETQSIPEPAFFALGRSWVESMHFVFEEDDSQYYMSIFTEEGPLLQIAYKKTIEYLGENNETIRLQAVHM